MLINLFEYASRYKLRFPSSKGALSVEQLWDAPLRSRDDFNLDAIAREASRALKALTEESFVDKGRTRVHEKAEVTFEVVKHVIQVKLEEEAEAEKRANARGEKERLLRIIAGKQEGRLSEMSEKELQEQIDALKF